MNDAWDTADLDARIGWTRAGLLAAASASDQQVELAAGLTQLFAERYARRAQAGDATGAKDDLVEMARLLDDVAAEIGAGDPRCTDLVLGAVFADKERWRAFGDDAACAAAVGRLDGLLTWLPESDLVWVDVHAELAMLRGARAEDAMPGDAELAELNAAIGHARLALDGLKRRADDAVDPAEVTGLRALLGFLLADRFRAVRRASDDVAAAATMADRQEAIEQFSDVLGMLDANDPDRPDVVAQLGLMRYNRYVDAEPEGRERDFVDLDTAIGLLTQSVPAAHPAASEHPAASARPAVPELSAGSNPAIADEPDLGVLRGLGGALGDPIARVSDAAVRNAP